MSIPPRLDNSDDNATRQQKLNEIADLRRKEADTRMAETIKQNQALTEKQMAQNATPSPSYSGGYNAGSDNGGVAGFVMVVVIIMILFMVGASGG